MAEEQIDYEEEEYGGSQKMQYQGGGAIPALADEELMGEDDEYDDLYNDVNVGEGFHQMQRAEAQAPSQPAGMGNGALQAVKTEIPDPRVGSGGQAGSTIPGISVESNYQNAVGLMPVKREEIGSGSYPGGSSAPQKGMTNDPQARTMPFQGSTMVPPNVGSDPSATVRKTANEPAPVINSSSAGPQSLPQNPPAIQVSLNSNVNHPMINENQIHPPVDNGTTMIFVGELHWWTTDAELEGILSQYGRIKEIKFFDERASGKSKGYCQVEFYESAAAAACKEGMDGHVFNGRACVVAFASQQTLKQMGASYMNKTQGQSQSQVQSQSQPRRPMNDGTGRGNNMNFQSGDAGRNYGRGGSGRGGPGMPNRGSWGGGPMRGRGGAAGPKNMVVNPGGMAGAAAGAYGQGLGGPAFGGPAGGMMHPQGMMAGGFDPTYMGRGGGYGGFPGPGFPGMMHSFPGVNTMGLAGVAPHVNPAFFGRGMGANGMGMMGSTGMEGPHAGMWTDTSMSGWGGEEHGRRTRESSYGGEDGASEYGYGEANPEKGGRSSAAPREKERAPEREKSGNTERTERRHRDERGQEWDRPEREHRDHRYREDKDSYRDHRKRERESGYEEDWDKGQSSSRPRSRSRAVPEDDHRSRSRDTDYGKRRRLPSE